MKSKPYLLACLMTGMILPLAAQPKVSVAEKLGYPANSKLLIIHADDMGMSHSTNMACIKAIESNSINSGSIMVPCPWFPEIADYLKTRPDFDAGIHLTLVSEWKYYKWGGVSPANEIPSLLDEFGKFQSDNNVLLKSANADEVEKELRAQIDRALASGIKLTHIDSHTGSIFYNPEILKRTFAISREYGLPLTIPMNMIKMMAPHLVSQIPEDAIIVDNYYSMYGEIAKGDWKTIYGKMIGGLQPGLNEMVFHLSYDNDEMKAIAGDQQDFGSAWRQQDLDFVTSEDFKKMLRENNVVLVTWREIVEKLKSNE